jgi:AraC-like DNA-binding protein
VNKIQLEQVQFDPRKSIRIFSPQLRNHFYWHYHPEFELVYVKADAGIRHVGTHMSGFTGSDLVFIGSNVPHLNFDYRVRNDYHQIVIQIKADFLSGFINQWPELSSIIQIFNKPGLCLSYYGKTKDLVAEKLCSIHEKNDFEQLMELLVIFQILSTSDEVTVLSDEKPGMTFFLKDKVRMGAIYEYIDSHYPEKTDVNTVAEKVHLTTPAFCRYFKKQTQMTFTDFVNQYRIDIAKNQLMQGKSVSETCFAVGFDSLSYFSRLFKKITGKNPSEFKSHWQ